MSKRTLEERIAAEQEKKVQSENKIKKLLQEQKASERTARNSRLFKRAGLLESLLPETIELTDEQFEAFLKMTTANDYGRGKLEDIKSKSNAEPKLEPPQSGDS